MIGVVGFEVGSEFFVQNLCTLISSIDMYNNDVGKRFMK